MTKRYTIIIERGPNSGDGSDERQWIDLVQERRLDAIRRPIQPGSAIHAPRTERIEPDFGVRDTVQCAGDIRSGAGAFLSGGITRAERDTRAGIEPAGVPLSRPGSA